MRFCDDHWQELRREIVDRGLEAFVAPSAEEATVRLENATRGLGSFREQFEPLLHSSLQIKMDLMMEAGVPDTGGCPLCWAIQHCDCKQAECGYRKVIGLAADFELKAAVKHGLIAQA